MGAEAPRGAEVAGEEEEREETPPLNTDMVEAGEEEVEEGVVVLSARS